MADQRRLLRKWAKRFDMDSKRLEAMSDEGIYFAIEMMQAEEEQDGNTA